MQPRLRSTIAAMAMALIVAAGGSLPGSADDAYRYGDAIAQPSWWSAGEVAHDIQPGQWLPCSIAPAAGDCIESILARPDSATDWQPLNFTANPAFDTAITRQVWQHQGLDGDADPGWPEGQFPGNWRMPAGMTTSDGSTTVGVFVAGLRGGVMITLGDPQERTDLPEGSQWQVRLRSSGLARHLGFVRANAHEPSVVITDPNHVVVTTAATVSYRVYGSSCEALAADASRRADTDRIRVEAILHTNGDTASGVGPASAVIATNGWTCFTNFRFDPTSGRIIIGVGTSHRDPAGNVIAGWMEAKISGALARSWWKMDPSRAATFAQVDVVYEDGTQSSATTMARYDAAQDWIDLRSYGFHFSTPVLQISIKAPAAAEESATATATPTPKPVQRLSILCSKGKTTKRVVGIKPKCPTGWKRIK